METEKNNNHEKIIEKENKIINNENKIKKEINDSEKNSISPEYHYLKRIDEAKEERIRNLKKEVEHHRNEHLRAIAEMEEMATEKEKYEKELTELRSDRERYRKLLDTKPVTEHKKEQEKNLNDILDYMENRKEW